MASQSFSLGQIAENNGKNGKPTWLIVKGGVYDVTDFIKEHPGGDESILEYAGKDATKAFNDVGHSADAIKEMKLYKIGVVEACNGVIKEAPTRKSLSNNELICDALPPTEEKKKRAKLFFCF